MRTASGSAHDRRTHPAMDATFTKHTSSRCLHCPRHSWQDITPSPSLKCPHSETDSQNTSAAHAVHGLPRLHPRDNSADKSRFATSQLCHWMPTLCRLEHLTDLRLAPHAKPRLLPPNRSRRQSRQPAQPPPPLPSGSSGGQIAGLMPVLGVVPSRPSRVSGHPTGAGALPP